MSIKASVRPELETQSYEPEPHRPRVRPGDKSDLVLALAAGDLHNRAIAEVFDSLGSDYDLAEFLIFRIGQATQSGLISRGDEAALRDLVGGIDLEAPDLGLARSREIRRRLIESDAGDLTIAIAGVAVGSIEFGLKQIGDSTQAAVRRRFWRIALSDIGGALGGGAAGGVVGAIVGAIGASLTAAAATSND